MTEPTTGTPDEAPAYRKRGRSKTPLFIAVVVVVAAALIAAAALWLGKEPAAAPGGDPGAGGEITIGLQLEPTNLDIRETGGVALDQILVDNIYQGLVGLASGTLDEYVPVLAESLPEVSEDGLSYTFTLREGVSFHSGNPLTADDVVDSLSATLVAGVIGTDATVTAPDERTIVIELSAPNSQLLWQLANRPGLIFETAYEGSLASTANGTGPYLLDSWKQGDSIAFVANPDYWGDAPAIERVVWRYIPDGNAAVNAALDGDVDVLAPIAPSLAEQLEGKAGFTIENAASTDVFTLGYNSAKAPLDDVRVRTALSKAIDSDAIIEAFYGDGKALGGPITDLEPAYEDLSGVNAYDPDGAKALLAEAGVEDLTLTLTVPSFYDQAPVDQIVTQFAEIGVTLEVDAVEFGAWLSDVYTAPEDGSPRDFDLSYIDHAEPFDFGNYANPGYYFGFDDAEVQRLYAASIAATDPEQAVDLVKQAARIVAEEAPARWLINYTPANAVNERVHGFPSSNTNSRINLEGITVE